MYVQSILQSQAVALQASSTKVSVVLTVFYPAVPQQMQSCTTDTEINCTVLTYVHMQYIHT